MKKEKAITLISLIITIIVLIILASVAIYLSLGNNGIFTRAKQAKELTNKQEATEIINLKITTAQMNKYAEKQENISLQELADILYEDNEIEYVSLERKVADKEKITVGDNETIYTKLNDYPYEFEINGKLQLASIDGAKLETNNNNPSSSQEPNKDYIAGYNAGKADADLKYIGLKLVTGVEGTVTFSVDKGTKYFVETLFICDSHSGNGYSNPVININNSESVTPIIRRDQYKGYNNVYAGRYNATFKAVDTNVDIYVRPNQTNNIVTYNMVVTLYSIS